MPLYYHDYAPPSRSMQRHNSGRLAAVSAWLLGRSAFSSWPQIIANFVSICNRGLCSWHITLFSLGTSFLGASGFSMGGRLE